MTEPSAARVTRSVALAITDPGDAARILVVRRPLDDADLPGAWGLPAASLRPGESRRDAAVRAARDKLGIDVRLGRALRQGTTSRGDGILDMILFEATIALGTVSVPQPVAGVTQYIAARWDTASALRDARARGSLCCRLYLESAEDGPSRT